eukprot:gene12842-26180_t
MPEPALERVDCKVGTRIYVDGRFDRAGIVRYVGKTQFNKKGIWIGVSLDEPTGKHGGLVGTTRYFSAKPFHGTFVRPNRINTHPFYVWACPDQAPAARHSSVVKAAREQKKTRSAAAKASRDGESSSAKKGRQLRYYIGSGGRKINTLKLVDPKGKPTIEYTLGITASSPGRASPVCV